MVASRPAPSPEPYRCAFADPLQLSQTLTHFVVMDHADEIEMHTEDDLPSLHFGDDEDQDLRRERWRSTSMKSVYVDESPHQRIRPTVGEGIHSRGRRAESPFKTAEFHISQETWKLYAETATRRDQERYSALNSDLDAMLIFSALFSAVLTTFVVEVYSTLQPDSVTVDTLLMQEIVSILRNNATAGSSIVSSSQTSFHPTTSAIRVNTLWFLSLVISISAAFLAILAKQWLFYLTVGFSPFLEFQGRQRQFRHDGVDAWKLPSIISALSVSLHVAVLLFFAGLVEFLWAINSIVAVVTTVLVGLTVVLYIASIFLSFVSLACPFKCSVMSVSLEFLDTLGREVCATVMTMMIYAIGRLIAGFIKVYCCFVGADGFSAKATALIQDLPSDFSKMRRQLKIAWKLLVSPHLTWTSRQDHCISAASTTTDSRALAWLVKEAPLLKSTDGLAEDLCRCPELSVHWLLFVSSGAVRLLDERLEAVYHGDFKSMSENSQRTTLLCSGALARLLTEWNADNLDFMSTRINGVQYSWSDPGIIDLRFHLCRTDEMWEDTDDLHFFAIMLRLQFFFCSKEWYHKGISRSAEKLYSVLQDPSATENLGDEALTELVNTAVYVASRMVYDVTGEANWKAWFRHASRALDGLVVLMDSRPSMGFSVYRQICYGIWLISVKMADYNLLESQARIGNNALILQVKDMGDLTRALGDVLGWDYGRKASPTINALLPIVTMMESLMCHAPDSSSAADEDQKGTDVLLNGLVKQLPAMLRSMRVLVENGREIAGFPRITHRVANICRTVFREAESRDQLNAYTEHVELAFGLLLTMSRLPSTADNEYLSVHKVIWGALYELALPWLEDTGRKKHHSLRVNLLSGDHTLEEFADGVASIVRLIENSSSDEPLSPYAVENLLSIMANLLQRYGSTDDETSFLRLRVLLLEPSRGFVECLAALRQANRWPRVVAALILIMEKTAVAQVSTYPVLAYCRSNRVGHTVFRNSENCYARTAGYHRSFVLT